MDQKLDIILDKLNSLESGQNELNKKMDVMKSGQDELYQIVRAIRDRQEETDAKLDALSMDVHHVHGEIAGVKEEIKELREGVIFVNRKVADTEYEVNLLKQRKQ